MIPLPPSKVHGIWKAIKPFDFDTTYGGFAGQNVSRLDLKAQVLESMKVSNPNPTLTFGDEWADRSIQIFLRMAGHEQAAVYEETL